MGGATGERVGSSEGLGGQERVMKTSKRGRGNRGEKGKEGDEG